MVSSRTFGSTKAALGFATKLKRRANVGRERQIAYVVLGVGEKADDTSNFSPTPVRESMPRTNEQLPFWDEW